MTPREYLRLHRHTKPTNPLDAGAPVDVRAGATVGVVLVGPGGPDGVGALDGFFERVFMDPDAVRIPLGFRQRERLARWLAKRRTRQVSGQFEAIGGRSPVARLADEQAGALSRRLDGGAVHFVVTTAMRYGNPSTEDAQKKLAAAGATDVVLVPLYPQYSPTRTGSSYAYWNAVAGPERGQVALVTSFAQDPMFLQAVSERIDEGLRRFPKGIRDEVHLLFVAHGLGPFERRVRGNPYCSQVHHTVNGVMQTRSKEAPFSLAFQEQPGRRAGMEPRLDRAIDQLGISGARGVLAVPISYTTDRVDSAYRLEVALRHRAEEAGIAHYHVVAPLNGHPLFVDALARCVRGLVRVDGEALAPALPISTAGCPRDQWPGTATLGSEEPRCGGCPHQAA